MSSLDKICNAVGATIKNFAQTQLEAHTTVSTVQTLPAIVVEPDVSDFAVSMQHGSDDWTLNVYVLCSTADAESGQNQLKGFCSGAGPDSIRQIIYDHADLGLGDCDAMAKGVRAYNGTYESGDIQAVGALIQIRVITDGRQ